MKRVNKLCVATKILNLKAIPSVSSKQPAFSSAVRCNKNTKSESYSQYYGVNTKLRCGCALQQKY